jgi:hypothetical protein
MSCYLLFLAAVVHLTVLKESLLDVVMIGSVKGRFRSAASDVLIASDDGTAWQIAYGAETTIESRA